jgi:hypothetical protein
MARGSGQARANREEPPDWRSATDLGGIHHAYVGGDRITACGASLHDLNLIDRTFGPDSLPMCRRCWIRTGGDDGFFDRGFGSTAEEILSRWEDNHRSLEPAERQRFQDKREVRYLRLLPLEAVEYALQAEFKLARALPLAEAFAAEHPQYRTPRRTPDQPSAKNRETRTTSGPSLNRASSQRPSQSATRRPRQRPGSGPFGFYGRLGKWARRPPDFDPHPHRMCPSCDRPESSCLCR